MKQNDRERDAFHRAEEQRHAEHMARRIAAREGDGTIEQGEAELASIRRIAKIRKLEAELAAVKAQLADAGVE